MFLLGIDSNGPQVLGTSYNVGPEKSAPNRIAGGPLAMGKSLFLTTRFEGIKLMQRRLVFGILVAL